MIKKEVQIYKIAVITVKALDEYNNDIELEDKFILDKKGRLKQIMDYLERAEEGMMFCYDNKILKLKNIKIEFKTPIEVFCV